MPDCNSFAGCNCDNLVWSGIEHIKGDRSMSVLLKGKRKSNCYIETDI
jgi:hypothetical protein